MALRPVADRRERVHGIDHGARAARGSMILAALAGARQPGMSTLLPVLRAALMEL